MNETTELATLNSTELIVLKQLPIIEQQLGQLKPQIAKAVDYALALTVNIDTVKEIKKVRADLRKRFEELETQRKALAAELSKPYEAFMLVYKDCVSNLLTWADGKLKERIDEVETTQKAEKAEEVIAFFYEYAASKQQEWLTFEQTGIKVGLSDTMPKLKEACRKFVDDISDDLMTISMLEHAEEITVEYKQNGFKAAQAINKVRDRYKAVEEEKARREAAAQAYVQQEQTVQKVEQVLRVTAPAVQPVEPQAEQAEEELEMTFTVTATMPMLKQLKQFLIEGGYKILQ